MVITRCRIPRRSLWSVHSSSASSNRKEKLKLGLIDCVRPARRKNELESLKCFRERVHGSNSRRRVCRGGCVANRTTGNFVAKPPPAAAPRTAQSGMTLWSRAGRREGTYLRAAHAYMLISMPTGTSTIFGVFQVIRELQVRGTVAA